MSKAKRTNTAITTHMKYQEEKLEKADHTGQQGVHNK